MTPGELRLQIERLGLTQTSLAAIIHRNPVSVRRWCRNLDKGGASPPRELALLLPLMTPEYAAELVAAERAKTAPPSRQEAPGELCGCMIDDR